MTEEQFNKIENYLKGSLSVEETATFKKHITQDEELATEVALQELELETVAYIAKQDFKAKVASWDKNPPPNPYKNKLATTPSTQKAPWKWWLGGALILFLIGALFQLLQPDIAASSAIKTDVNTISPDIFLPVEENKENLKQDTITKRKEIIPSEKKEMPIAATKPKSTSKPVKSKPLPPTPKANKYRLLAMNTYEVTNFISNIKSGSTTNTLEEKTAYEKAAIAFDAKQYKTAAKFIGNPSDNEESKNRYLRGHIYFKLKDFPKATTEFKAVFENDVAEKSVEAEWYLLLSYLAQLPDTQEEFDKATKEFLQFGDAESIAKLKEILKQIGE